MSGLQRVSWLQRSIAALGMAGLTMVSSGCAHPDPPAQPPAERIVGVGYEDVVRADMDWADVEARLTRVRVTGVTIAVGRPEWLAFPWEGREADWAAPVRAGSDPVRQAIDGLRGDGPTRRTLTLTIDALAPRLIESDPEAAAVAPDGTPSREVANAAALAGAYGDRLAETCGEVARRYRPDRVALAELFVEDTVSEADLALYRAQTGVGDWPRTDSGDIDTRDAALLRWRAAVVTDVAARCAQAAGEHGVAAEADVRAAWNELGAARPDSGHDYAQLLRRVERVTVWNYLGLVDRPPEYSAALTRGISAALGSPQMSRVTMSVGLWAQNGQVLDHQTMARALQWSASHGVTSVSLTPLSLMTPEHWDALEGAWVTG